MKKLICMLLAAIMLLSMAACGQQSAAESSAPQETEAVVQQTEAATEPEETEAGPRTVTVTDMSGDEVTIEGEIESIVNLWPAGTSSFFVMGAGDMISALAVNNAGTMNGWTKFFYPESVNIPALGGTEPSIEDIVNLDPDLVIIHPMSSASGFAQQIRDLGIPAININFSDYASMTQAYTLLGEILGGEYQEKLNNWCAEVNAKIEKNRSLTADLAEEEKPVVYYIAGQSDSLTTTMGISGASNIMQDWIESNGGRFASAVLNLEGSEVTAEEIFELDPDIIIVGGVYQHDLIERLNTTDGWKDLSAVKNGRVYGNPYACFNWDRFGMESLLQIDFALLCIQPEIAAENGIDADAIVEEIKTFYATYNGAELTDEQANNMLGGLLPDGTIEEPAAGGQGGGNGGGQGNGQGGGKG